MEWDEVFALLTIGSTAPYAIEAAAAWFKGSWHISQRNGRHGACR